jgi:hypothetical protein
MIKSMGTTVLVPHLARHGFNNVVVVSALSCAICKRADVRAFECHQHANIRTFVLGRGRRDNGTNGVIVGNSGARGDIHRGRHGADDAKGDADDIIC